MKIIALILVFLGGCTTTSLEERAMYCDDEAQGEDFCQDLRDRYDRRVELEEKRRGTCPVGYVKFVVRGESSCVSQEQVWRWMNQRPY